MRPRDPLGIREPVPQPGQSPTEYHILHQTYGNTTDGRCEVCYPPAKKVDTVEELKDLPPGTYEATGEAARELEQQEAERVARFLHRECEAHWAKQEKNSPGVMVTMHDWTAHLQQLRPPRR